MPHLFDWQEIDDAVWTRCIESAIRHRQDRRWHTTASGRSIGLVFFNPSLRTRTSMELAARELGAHATVLNVSQGLWGIEWRDGVRMDGDAAEHVREAFGVLSRYYDALGVRLFASMTDYEMDRSEQAMRAVIASSTSPIINLESAFYHPCQALGDAATLMDRFDGNVAGKKFVLTWAPHVKPLPMAVPNSALLTAARLGFEVVVARPDGYELDEGVMRMARKAAAARGSSVTETSSAEEAFEGASVIYAKAWGGRLAYDDPEREARLRNALPSWTVTADRMRRTDGAVFLHCLPVRRGVVVEDSVLDGPRSAHLLQAEYRLHGQKAILEYVWDL